jgi:hypothetical protein
MPLLPLTHRPTFAARKNPVQPHRLYAAGIRVTVRAFKLLARQLFVGFLPFQFRK